MGYKVASCSSSFNCSIPTECFTVGELPILAKDFRNQYNRWALGVGREGEGEGEQHSYIGPGEVARSGELEQVRLDNRGEVAPYSPATGYWLQLRNKVSTVERPLRSIQLGQVDVPIEQVLTGLSNGCVIVCPVILTYHGRYGNINGRQRGISIRAVVNAAQCLVKDSALQYAHPARCSHQLVVLKGHRITPAFIAFVAVINKGEGSGKLLLRKKRPRLHNYGSGLHAIPQRCDNGRSSY